MCCNGHDMWCTMFYCFNTELVINMTKLCHTVYIVRGFEDTSYWKTTA